MEIRNQISVKNNTVEFFNYKVEIDMESNAMYVFHIDDEVCDCFNSLFESKSLETCIKHIMWRMANA